MKKIIKKQREKNNFTSDMYTQWKFCTMDLGAVTVGNEDMTTMEAEHSNPQYCSSPTYCYLRMKSRCDNGRTSDE